MSSLDDDFMGLDADSLDADDDFTFGDPDDLHVPASLDWFPGLGDDEAVLFPDDAA